MPDSGGAGGRGRSSRDQPGPRLAADAGGGRAAYLDDWELDEREVVEALQRLDPLWDELFPAEQARILQLLVGRVAVRLDGPEISLRVEGTAVWWRSFSLATCGMLRQ